MNVSFIESMGMRTFSFRRSPLSSRMRTSRSLFASRMRTFSFRRSLFTNENVSFRCSLLGRTETFSFRRSLRLLAATSGFVSRGNPALFSEGIWHLRAFHIPWVYLYSIALDSFGQPTGNRPATDRQPTGSGAGPVCVGNSPRFMKDTEKNGGFAPYSIYYLEILPLPSPGLPAAGQRRRETRVNAAGRPGSTPQVDPGQRRRETRVNAANRLCIPARNKVEPCRSSPQLMRG